MKNTYVVTFRDNSTQCTLTLGVFDSFEYALGSIIIFCINDAELGCHSQYENEKQNAGVKILGFCDVEGDEAVRVLVEYGRDDTRQTKVEDAEFLIFRTNKEMNICEGIYWR